MASQFPNPGDSDHGALPPRPSDSIVAYCDGGSRGNPGPAGFGVLIQDGAGKVLAEFSRYLGLKTNNFAEYSALLAALEFALSNGHRRLRVVSDSELMVKQMKGQYRVNSPDLRPLYEEARRRAGQLDQFQIQHVLREKNRHADRLANLAMDRGTGKTPPVPPAAPVGSAPKGAARETKPVRGFVKSGVVHLLEGELPDGIFVRVIPE